MFKEKDIKQFENKGISIQTINKQIENFHKGFPYVYLVAPATIGNGIIAFTKEEVDELQDFFDKSLADNDISKFVPASGAATRMFKHLFAFRKEYRQDDEENNKYLEDKSFNSVFNFINNIKKFAFHDELKEIMDKDGHDIEACIEKKDFNTIIDYLLLEKGLDYGKLPKGLIKFHNYPDGARKSIEEHLVETAHYCNDNSGKVAIQFTVSPEHLEKFKEEIQKVKPIYEKLLDVEFDIQFSLQKPSTDTIAVDMEDEPFREADGSILFRPGGHGALIENLNDIDHDIIFIKNIDNIVPDKLREETYRYKKVIGGYLLKLRKQIYEYLKKLEGNNISIDEIEEIADFATNELSLDLPKEFNRLTVEKKSEFLFNKLHRPIRICGMVKNEGEPGGGPFWIKDPKEEISLQIVEKSQINMDDPGQKLILNKSTHFNPVDLVCSIKDHHGKAFDLRKFVDPSTGFISIKSKDGRNLKAQELPGLWNGAMANWITLFVETPIITFNPVKTINDLLRPAHQ